MVAPHVHFASIFRLLDESVRDHRRRKLAMKYWKLWLMHGLTATMLDCVDVLTRLGLAKTYRGVTRFGPIRMRGKK